MNTPEDLVARWALDRLDIIGSGSIQADQAFQNFREWCTVHDLKPLTPQMFGRRFTKVHTGMGGKKVRRQGRAYYIGTSLQFQSLPKALIKKRETSADQIRKLN